MRLLKKRWMVSLVAILMLAFSPFLSCLVQTHTNTPFVALSEDIEAMETPKTAQENLVRSRDARIQTNAMSSFVRYTEYIGNNQDDPRDIAIDENESIYIVGRTSSTNLLSNLGITVANSYLDVYPGGPYSGFLIKFNDSGVEYGTYFGGSATDQIESVAIDSVGRVWIAGLAHSLVADGFPVTVNAYDGVHGGVGYADGFVAVFSPNGTTLEYSTYVGGLANDKLYDIALDGADNAWVVGLTDSTNYPTEGASLNDTKFGGTENTDGVLTCLNDSGGIPYSTFIGGTENDDIRSLVLEDSSESLSSGSVTVGIVGLTKSTDYQRTSGCYDNIKGTEADWFFLKHTTEVISGLPTGQMDYSTFIGGGISDISSEYYYKPQIGYDPNNSIYVMAGTVIGDEFGATGRAPQSSNGGNDDIYAFWITPTGLGASDVQCGTYWGGSNDEEVNDLIVDRESQTIIVGQSKSTNFPTVGWRSKGLDTRSSRNSMVVRFDPPELRGTRVNLSTLHYTGNIWDQVWACDLKPDNYNIVSLADGTSTTELGFNPVICDYTMPTEPFLGITGSNLPDRTGETIRITANVTEGTYLPQAEISHVYLTIWWGDNESASVFASVPDSKASEIWEGFMEVNKSAEYTWTFTPYTKDGGRARKSGSFNVTGPTIGGVSKPLEADELGIDEIWGLNGIGWYVLVILITIGLMLFGFFVAKGKAWGIIPIVSVLGFLGTFMVINMPWFWWQLIALMGVLYVCSAHLPALGWRGFSLSLAVIFWALFASSLYLVGIGDGWTIAMMIGGIITSVAPIPKLSKLWRGISGIVGVVLGAVVSGIVSGVF